MTIGMESKKLVNAVPVSEAARRLGIHRVTIYRWKNKGKILVILYEGVLYIPLSEIERLKGGTN